MLKAAWLAGLFDGEGNCSLLVYPKRKNHGLFCPQVTISQTKKLDVDIEKIFKEIAEKFGGKIQRVKRGNWSELLVLRFTSLQSIKSFLGFIKDDSIIKRRQIELMLEFCDLKKPNTMWQGQTLERACEIAYEITRVHQHSSKKTLERIEKALEDAKRKRKELEEKIGTGLRPKGCKFCGSFHIVKDGFDRRRKQRWKCRECKRVFLW